eukprot:gene5607-5845_t
MSGMQMCPKNTYQDSESMAKSCSRCPNGLQTQLEGATGGHLCLTPPGMELKPGAAMPTACGTGYYKSGWNRDLCFACKGGLTTDGGGAVDADACIVPAGSGIITLANGAQVVVPCIKGFYGSNASNSNSIRQARCMACPANMVTPDVISGVSPAGGYTSSADCVNRPGHGMSALNQISEKCETGSWSAGLSRGECIPCPGGFTTLMEGSTSEDACVVQPGW